MPQARSQKSLNPNCDHRHCRKPDGEVRKLPSPVGDGFILLCETCFRREMKERQQFNKETGEKLWDILKWSDLEVCELT